MQQGARNSCSHLATVLLALVAMGGPLWSCGEVRDEAGPAAVAPILDVPGHDSRKTPRELDDRIERVDPSVDGWTTEVLNERLGDRLHDLAHALETFAGTEPEDLTPLVAAEARIGPIRPESLDRLFEDPAVKVSGEAEVRGAPDVETAIGPEALTAELRRLLAPFAGAPDLRVKFKLVHIDVGEGDAVSAPEIEVYYQAVGDPPSGRVQQNAVWNMVWRVGNADTPARLLSLDSGEFREAIGPAPGGGLFSDHTEAVLGADSTYREQLTPGQPHWGRTLDSVLGSQLLGHHGLAVGDVDGDGLEDLYLAQAGGLPNRLFLHQPDGKARDAAAESGVDYLDATTGALLVDLDNDGDQDLVIAADSLVIHENDGSGRFEPRAVVPTTNVMSLAAADYDNDGDLDLYACRYSSPEDSSPVPYHDARNGSPNQLLRNDGAWVFSDATTATGMDDNNDRYSFAASWADFDDDGWIDLYVANDFGRNNLYRNVEGRFTDVAATAGVEDISAGMSATWGDANSDGALDVYVSNMFSSAGNRTAYQRRFQDTAESSIRQQYQRHARGNSLFLNSDDGTFVDSSLESRVTMGRWAWASKFTDFNNDGLEDILVLNGYVTNEGQHDL